MMKEQARKTASPDVVRRHVSRQLWAKGKALTSGVYQMKRNNFLVFFAYNFLSNKGRWKITSPSYFPSQYTSTGVPNDIAARFEIRTRVKVNFWPG